MGAAVAVVSQPSSKAPTSPALLPLLLSAAKSVVGHTEAAAGVVGLCHAITDLGATSASPIAHLQSLGGHLSAALENTGVEIPRQLGGALTCDVSLLNV